MGRTCNILWVAEKILCEILRHRPSDGLTKKGGPVQEK